MLNSTKSLAGAVGAFLVVAFMLVLSLPSIADSGVNDELGRCTAVSDASARLACYDGLAGRQEAAPAIIAVPAVASPPVMPPPAETSPSVMPLPDELGSGAFGRKDDNEEAAVVVRVVRCVKDAHKDFSFYLDGGQVWKQISDKKLFYKDCDFNATIGKDVFGYTMQMEGASRTIRVKRIR